MPPFAGLSSRCKPGPAPVSATWVQLTKLLTVTFDKPIEGSGPWDATNWWYQFSLTGRYPGLSVAHPFPAVLTITCDAFAASISGQVGTNYDPPPHDVIATDTTSAAAFYGYPTT